MVKGTPKEIAKAYQDRAQAIRRMGIDTHRRAGQFAWHTMQRLAPVKSGALKSGIVINKQSQDRTIVASGVPGNFSYHFWVNMEPTLLTVRGHTYPEVKKSPVGVARYFDLAVQATRLELGRDARVQLNKIIIRGN